MAKQNGKVVLKPNKTEKSPRTENLLHKKKAKKRKYFEVAKAAKQDPAAKKDKTEPKTTSARIPTKPEEASSNWKNLLKSIRPDITGTVAKKRKIETSQSVKVKETAESSQVETVTKSKVAHKEVWFDNVDPVLLDSLQTVEKISLVKDGGFKGTTKSVAIDCEMVGVGPDGADSALARVSIVNHYGHCIYDKYVLPGEEVTDYRTHVSGIRPHNLKDAHDLGIVRQEVTDILRGKILVGHALRNDLQALLIKHPKSKIRDTSKFKLFRSLVNGSTPSLKLLSNRLLGVTIQSGEHSSVQDAQAAMRLYTMFRQKWEAELSSSRRERLERLTKAREDKREKKTE